jgi:glutamyl-Q tRNA(Asp) synthetase
MTGRAVPADPVLRFAPSPNGQLHLGHALSALICFDMSRRLGGRYLIRIEDIDTLRCQPELIAAALEDLAWLGVVWEEPVLRQSEHFGCYGEAAGQLREMGLLYPCFATRTGIAAACRSGEADPDGAPLYPGLWRGADAQRVRQAAARGEACCWRLDMKRALAIAAGRHPGPLTFVAVDEAGGSKVVVVAQPERWGDAVIIRKDTPASYHLCVVVDDARQGITHVTRGLDLLAATDLHRLLQVLLDLPEPVYHHHRLITDPVGRKLSKSAGDTALAEFRLAGMEPQAIRERLGLAAG